MATILLAMAVVAGIGVVYAIQEIVQERRELKDRLGPEWKGWQRRRDRS